MTTTTTPTTNGNSQVLTNRDVLLGRGGQTNNHEGNKHFREVVAEHQNKYLSARKKEKIVIARMIVDQIQKEGGRFLKRADNGEDWVPVTDKRAQEKTSQALREGLDVRNNAVRPPKRSNPKPFGDEQRPQKRSKVVQGKVVASSASPAAGNTSPSIVSQPGDASVVPTLDAAPNVMPALPPSILQYQRQISKSAVLNEVEV